MTRTATDFQDLQSRFTGYELQKCLFDLSILIPLVPFVIGCSDLIVIYGPIRITHRYALYSQVKGTNSTPVLIAKEYDTLQSN